MRYLEGDKILTKIGMGRDGTGRDGTGRDGTGRDRTGRVGIGSRWPVQTEPDLSRPCPYYALLANKAGSFIALWKTTLDSMAWTL